MQHLAINKNIQVYTLLAHRLFRILKNIVAAEWIDSGTMTPFENARIVPESRVTILSLSQG